MEQREDFRRATSCVVSAFHPFKVRLHKTKERLTHKRTKRGCKTKFKSKIISPAGTKSRHVNFVPAQHHVMFNRHHRDQGSSFQSHHHQYEETPDQETGVTSAHFISLSSYCYRAARGRSSGTAGPDGICEPPLCVLALPQGLP